MESKRCVYVCVCVCVVGHQEEEKKVNLEHEKEDYWKKKTEKVTENVKFRDNSVNDYTWIL